MLRLLAVSSILFLVSMSGEGSATKPQPKQRNAAIVDVFRRAGLDTLVRGKWLTAPMWARYINAFHSLADGTLVTGDNLHDAVRRDPAPFCQQFECGAGQCGGVLDLRAHGNSTRGLFHNRPAHKRSCLTRSTGSGRSLIAGERSERRPFRAS